MKKHILLILVLIFSCKNDSSDEKIQKNETLKNKSQSTLIHFLTKPKDTLHFKNRIYNFPSIVNILNENGLEKELIFLEPALEVYRSRFVF